MSSAVYITLSKPIERKAWAIFCKEQKIAYSPTTVGGNMFYRFGHDGVQIAFGDPSRKDAPKLTDRLPPQTMFETVGHDDVPPEWVPQRVFDWAARLPPESAEELTISSYFGENLERIADTAKRVLNAFGGTWEADPELIKLMTGL